MNPAKTSMVNRALLLSLAAASAFFLIHYFSDYNHVFVQPIHFEYQRELLLKNGPVFSRGDFIRLFEPFGEQRGRFLMYFFLLLDYRLRSLAYSSFVFLPSASLTWFFTLLVGPYFLFRLLKKWGSDAQAALAGLVVYMTSTGFLSGFTQWFNPGKPLVNAAMIVSVYLAARVKEKAKKGELFYQVRAGFEKCALFIVMAAGLFLDETALFVFALIPFMFRELFMPKHPDSSRRKQAFFNFIFFLTPLLFFLAALIGAVPLVTERYFQYRYDYLGQVFVSKKFAELGQKSFFAGPYGGADLKTLAHNFLTLFGLSWVPWQISPLVTHVRTGAVYGGQANTAPQWLIIFNVLAGMVFLSSRARGESGACLRRWLAATVACVFFMGALMGRHVLYMTGFYYGSAFGLFFAVLTGLCYAEIKKNGDFPAIFSTLAVSAIVWTQLNNFIMINQSYIDVSNQEWAHFGRPFAVIRSVSKAELERIRSASKRGELDAYLRRNPVSAGAVYLAVELKRTTR